MEIKNHSARVFPSLWIVALVLSSLACATLTRGVPLPQTPSAPNHAHGLIAYLGTDGNIHLTDQNGASQFPVTENAQTTGHFQSYQYPTWSMDGKHLAFISLEITDDAQTGRILIFTPETGETTEIFSDANETPFYLYWSPDNVSLSFLTSAVNAPHLFLRLAFLNGEPSRIADTGQPYYWVWAPDGKQFFVHEGGLKSHNPDARLTLSSPTEDLTQTFELAPANFQAPAWSPDGQQLLAAIVKDRHHELALLDLNGTQTQTFTEFNTNISFSWSPNGDRIAYLVTTLESNGFLAPLTVVNTNTPELSLTSTEKNVLAYFWAPDSQKIAYFTLETSEDIQATLIRTNYQNTLKLGLYVMDVQTGLSQHLATFEPTEEWLSILPVFDQYHHSVTIWSPDSANLVYTALSGDNAHVWLVPVSGGTPVQLADGTLAFWSWK